MSYQSEIEIVEGTFGVSVPLQCQDKDGNGVPLTGYTVYWHIWKDGETSCRLKGLCTEDDLSVGKVDYDLLEANWGTSKLEGGQEYRSSLVATKDGARQEFPSLLVKTIRQAPKT